ncbi:Protein CapI [Nymphon striatum]|nr:Protein CapI [Nymphon striatum]
MWQMGGLGPMAGQTHHFRVYAPENVPYAIDRYTNEVNRLYGVLNKRLAGRDFIAGEYSIADMACIGWAQLWERQGQDIQQFPNLEKWIERMKARPAVAAGLALGLEKREQSNFDKDKDQQAVLACSIFVFYRKSSRHNLSFSFLSLQLLLSQNILCHLLGLVLQDVAHTKANFDVYVNRKVKFTGNSHPFVLNMWLCTRAKDEQMARYEIGNADFADMASSGNAEVLFELGLVYAAGRDGEQDMIAAHKWFNLAAYKGFDTAKARREEIALDMSREQIAQAQREAREQAGAIEAENRGGGVDAEMVPVFFLTDQLLMSFDIHFEANHEMISENSEDFELMSYLITGAAGFIGFHLAKSLLDAGHSHFEFGQVDIADEKQLDDFLDNKSFTKIVHLAAQAGVRYSLENPRAYIQSNLVGHLNMLEVARNKSGLQHMLYASSSSVYGGRTDLPFKETDRADTPISLYAATKKSDELISHTYAHLYAIPLTGLRFFTVYGPWGRPDMAYFSFTKKILAGEQIEVFNHGDMLRDFTYIDDIIAGMIAILDKGPVKQPNAPHKVYNIGNNNPESLEDFLTTLENELGRKAIRKNLPMQPGDVPATYADISSIKSDYGFEPKTGLKAGLGSFAAWYRQYYKH